MKYAGEKGGEVSIIFTGGHAHVEKVARDRRTDTITEEVGAFGQEAGNWLKEEGKGVKLSRRPQEMGVMFGQHVRARVRITIGISRATI